MPAPISEEYWERAFQIWYVSGRPSAENLRDKLPDLPEGGQTTAITIRTAMERYGWHERADGMDAMAVQKVENDLIDARADMFRKQAEESRKVANMAMDYLSNNGFENAGQAVTALFKALEREERVRGMGDMLIKISKMTPDQLQSAAQRLLKRKNDAIDGEVIEEGDENVETQ